MKNPNLKKFRKNREFTLSWEKIPLYYTGLKKSDNHNKELVIMEDFGKHVSACWRNHSTCKVGITFLLKKTKFGFIYKDKLIKFINCRMVF